MEYSCSICNKTFARKQRNDRPRVFCSKLCYWESKLGKTSWNKGLKSTIPAWNKGLPMSEEAKLKLSIQRKGKHFSTATEFKLGQTSPRKGIGELAYKTDKGYIKVLLPTHPKADHAGYIFEHRMVAERCLHRRLDDDEVVHHLDEDRANNLPSNLYVFENNWEHLAFHARRKKYGVSLTSNILD